MSEEVDLPFDPVEPVPGEFGAVESKNIVLPKNYYEAEITAAGMIPWNFWDKYVTECAEKGIEPFQDKKIQLQLEFTVMHEEKEVKILHWISNVRSGGEKKSFLFLLLEAMGKDPMGPWSTAELVGNRFKVSIAPTLSKKGETYNKIDGGNYELIT